MVGGKGVSLFFCSCGRRVVGFKGFFFLRFRGCRVVRFVLYVWGSYRSGFRVFRSVKGRGVVLFGEVE